MTKIGDKKLAQEITRLYAEGLGGLTRQECESTGLEKTQCPYLQFALGGDPDEGEITAKEKRMLQRAQFSDEFIDELAGPDGLKALDTKTHWLMDRASFRSWSSCLLSPLEYGFIYDREQHDAADALSQITSFHSETDPFWISMFNNPKGHKNYFPFTMNQALVKMDGERVKFLIPKLFEKVVLKEPGWSVFSFNTIIHFKKYIDAIPTLVHGLHNEFNDIHDLSYNALVSLGVCDSEIFYNLTGLLQESNDDESAFRSLQYFLQTKDTAVIPFITDYLMTIENHPAMEGDPERFTKTAFEIIKRLGFSSAKDTDVVKWGLLLGHENPYLQALALEALWGYEGDITPTIGFLETMAQNHPEPYYRQRAQRLLDKLKEENR